MDSVKKLLGRRSMVRGRHKAREGAQAAGETEAIDQEELAGLGLYVFTLKEMELITQNFSDPFFDFEYGYRTVYKGFIDDKFRPGLKAQTVSIRKRHRVHPLDHREWLEQVMLFARLRHPHLVKLIGFCYQDEQRMILCEYTYGRLQNWPHSIGWAAYLPWSTRMKIALGVAKGLCFLHEYEIPVTYRNFRPSDILLDLDYTAKLSETGLFRTSTSGNYPVFVAPESVGTGHMTAKSNVYSFGVLLVYFLSGTQPFSAEQLHVRHPMLKDAGELARIIDPKLEGQYAIAGALKVAALAYQCLSLDPEERPTMSTVVKTLEPLNDSDDIKTRPFVEIVPMENDMKKEDHAKAVEKEVKKQKSLHLHGEESSSKASPAAYEVVLSFSNDQSEIIKLFMAEMFQVRINVFGDVEKVHESLNQFCQAIDSTKICIPVLSKQYLTSLRCLHELSYIVEARAKSDAMEILPIFYDVEPSEVMLDRCSYMFTPNQQRVWKKRVEGWQMKDKDKIINWILNKLKLNRPTAGFVRMEDQIKEVKKSLDIESGSVLFVGIHGTGGVGKTNLARFIFDELADQFEKCSFLHNIRETSENWSLRYLQDQLSRDIVDIDSDYEEIEFKRMKDRLLNKKVLIVLDDVNQREQINSLVGKGSSFGSGSRIIITTQDPRVLAVEHDTIDSILNWPKEIRTCEVRGLAPSLALQLFCRHAFREDSPPDEYRDISTSLVEAIGGLPLALETIGSFLSDRPKDVWDSTLERLSQVPHLEVKEQLLISYESLDYQTKQIFLDIACFFCNKDKTYPVYMWDACNFYPKSGLEFLMEKCFLKIGDDNKLRMHDQVKEFGREMARKESFKMGLAQCSRLWLDEESLHVLMRKEEDVKGKMEVEALSLGYDESLLDWTFTNESFGRRSCLRFLELPGVQLAGNFENHLPNLRWLQWHSCPEVIEATNLALYKLIILDLSRSQLSHDWSGWSRLGRSPRLKVLNLTSCKSLYCTPDFSSYKVLERLILEDCTNLVEVDGSIGLLKELKYLNLNGCTSLNALPRRIVELTSLLNLEMDGTGVAELPFDIGRLSKLNHLVLSSCSTIEQLPLSVGDLTLLVHMDLGRTKITELPESIRNVKMLKVLKIEYSSITRLSKSIGMLESLEELHARHCEDLAGEVPNEIGGLSNLRMMDLSFSKVCSFPKTIRQLSRLQTLRLESCNELQQLPELPESLVRLTITQNQPALLNWQRRTKWLSGTSIKNIRRWIGKLSKLESLELCIRNITKLELHASQLSSLSLSCQDLELFPQFPASLSRLCLLGLTEKTEISTLGNTKKLTFLELSDCSIRNALGSLGLGQIESLEHLSATRCNFTSLNVSNLPKRLRVLCLSRCQLLHELDLTGLINLIRLDITSCNKLKEIRGLGELLCLEEVSICSCDLLERLGDLSNLVKLEGLKLNQCEKLKEVEGLDKIKSLKNLQICGCKSLENFHDKVGAKKQKLHLRIKA